MKFTWHSVIGILSASGGVVTALVGSSALPESVSAVLVSAGALILAVDRWAQSQEGGATSVAITTTKPPTVVS